ncbi:TerD family protein [Streptomyces carpaticus]|uniref:TerD family protein n=1 Tax=Streptomyces carpaticus TaxID=285558 RepID=A0ABV4ZJA6_9ACTN
MTHALDKGATVRLPVTSVRAVLRWSPRGPGGADLDLSALLLGGTGRVRSPGDFVFYNQPRHPTGLVRRLPKQRDGHGLLDTVEAELARLDPAVGRVVLAASAERGFDAARSHPRLLLYGAFATEPLARFAPEPGPGETAVICGELYRSGDGWHFRASGLGFRGGLVALAAEFGVTAAAPPPSAAPQASAAPPPDPRRGPGYGYPPAGALPVAPPAPDVVLPLQGPQFLPPAP